MNKHIDNKISYKEIGATITVRLGKRIVGTVDGGFCYQSAGGKNRQGEIFKTVSEVKQSLEGK